MLVVVVFPCVPVITTLCLPRRKKCASASQNDTYGSPASIAARASGLSGRATLPITTTRSGTSRSRAGSQPFCTSIPAARSWSLIGG